VEVEEEVALREVEVVEAVGSHGEERVGGLLWTKVGMEGSGDWRVQVEVEDWVVEVGCSVAVGCSVEVVGCSVMLVVGDGVVVGGEVVEGVPGYGSTV